MKTKFIEAKGVLNWGKFAVCRFEPEEWNRRSKIDPGRQLLDSQGWDDDHLWVLDLATGEGAYFSPRGLASADLDKHRIWVCPLFEPFLEWLYKQKVADLDALPDFIELPNAEASLQGYRRPGTQNQ
jgi:hypothetical protein